MKLPLVALAFLPCISACPVESPSECKQDFALVENFADSVVAYQVSVDQLACSETDPCALIDADCGRKLAVASSAVATIESRPPPLIGCPSATAVATVVGSACSEGRCVQVLSQR